MPSWTKEQEEAINSDGENIIVSAGAGSGKTAVLTSRVIRKLENNVSISNLLILTFTNLAASEMKTRIRDEIKKKLELREELKKIDSSFITTFDSFSLSLVKKYHYLLGVKKDVDIIDSNLLKLKTKEFLDNILEEEYQVRNNDFTKLINDFCIKDDKEIRDIILTINDKLDLKYDKKEYLDKYLDNYYNKEFITKNIENYYILLKNIISEIDNNLTKISNETSIDYYHKLSDVIMPIIESNSYNDIKKSVVDIKLPQLPKGSSDDAKLIKEKIKNSLLELKELTRFNDLDEIYNSIILTMPYIKAIIRIIKKLDDMLITYKFENDLYDFIDICKMAIKLVKENEIIKNEIKYSFNEIMIDEYQDTSDLQEEFIREISNNNVYVVGDVKQSIYRFRNANPNLFRHKYNLYAKGINGKKIDLLKNFRSRPEVLSNINLIFNYVMSELIGGADYIHDHQMIPGNDSYNKLGMTSQNNNFEIYSYEYNKEIGFNKEEIEAFIIARDIINKVSNHYQVFDKKKNELRDITYNDFAILLDRGTDFNVYKKVFLYNQIPLSVYKDEKLTDSEIFMVIRNIFKLINLVYEKKFDIEFQYAYLSIGRSFLFNYNDDELFNVITNNKIKETDIFEKAEKITNNLSSKTIMMILDEIIEEFDFYEKLRKIPDLYNNYVKIDYLYNLSSNLNKMGYTTVEFNSFLDEVLNSDSDIKFSINKEDGISVKIMTIHASKGLEYPICYYPGLYKKFNDQEIKNKIVFSNLLGIITPYFDNGIDSTFYKELFKENYFQDEVSEKIRLFYVALTRAREKMIFVMPNSETIEEYEDNLVSDNIRLNYNSFSDIINSIKSKIIDYYKEIDINSLNLTKEYNLINSKNLFNNIKDNKDKIELIDCPKINLVAKSQSHFSKNNVKVFSKNEIDKMEFGTKMHYYLETLDLKKPNISDIPSPYKEKIKEFLNSDLLSNINDAKVYQEYEFIENSDIETKHGIIDLMIEYDNYINIIDYKLKNILDDAYVRQLSGYKEYIEKITNKPVNIYLYSIIDSVYRKIEKYEVIL